MNQSLHVSLTSLSLCWVSVAKPSTSWDVRFAACFTRYALAYSLKSIYIYIYKDPSYNSEGVDQEPVSCYRTEEGFCGTLTLVNQYTPPYDGISASDRPQISCDAATGLPHREACEAKGPGAAGGEILGISPQFVSEIARRVRV